MPSPNPAARPGPDRGARVRRRAPDRRRAGRPAARPGRAAAQQPHRRRSTTAATTSRPSPTTRLSVHRPGTNLRWIGSVNWALDSAAEHGDSVCIVINNDTRLSPDFAYWLASAFTDCADVAVAAACYDDFWLHQRAHVSSRRGARLRGHPRLPARCRSATAPRSRSRSTAAAMLGGLDQEAFPDQGYGADIDYALRAREPGPALRGHRRRLRPSPAARDDAASSPRRPASTTGTRS